MMRSIAALLLFAGACWSQQTSTTPDCNNSFQVTIGTGGTGTSASFPATSTPTGTPCVKWRVTYQANSATAFSGLNVSLQGAPDANGSPGTFTLWTGAGTIIEGSNPATALVSGTFLAGPGTGTNGIYYPWVNILVNSVTGSGTVSVKLLGYRGSTADTASSSGSSGCVGTVMTPCIVAGPTAAGMPPTNFPELTAGWDGTNIQIPLVDSAGNTHEFLGCPNSIQTALSGTGYTQIIAGSVGKVLYLCKVFVTSASSGTPVVNTITFATGTCAGSPTQILTAAGITGLDEDFGGALRSASGAAFCVKEATANSDLVTATYAQF